MPKPVPESAPQKVRVGIVGCGVIAEPYAEDLAASSCTELVGFSDLDPARAERLAGKHGARAYKDLEAMLADDSLPLQLIVNLTIHHAHYQVTKKCLEAGKHVYSEKPLAMSFREAQELVELAKARGLRLGCSPFTFLGEAQQTAWKLLREEALGTVHLAYAEVNWGRIESWHPAPAPFYEVGVLYDVGVYPLTLLTAFFGPARRVLAYGRVVFPERVTKRGAPFRIDTPDFVTTALELEGGVLVRLTTTFYVGQHSKQAGVEIHGDRASLFLSRWDAPDALLELAEFSKTYETVAPLRLSPGMRWGRGVQELAAALLENRPQRATGEHAAHVVEILEATTHSLQSGTPADVHSSFPLPWAV